MAHGLAISQRSSAKAAWTFQSLSQAISKSSEHPRRFDRAHGDLAVMATLFTPAGMAIKKKPMNTHDTDVEFHWELTRAGRVFSLRTDPCSNLEHRIFNCTHILRL